MTSKVTKSDIAPIAELFTKLGAMLGQQVTHNGAAMTAGEAAWLKTLEYQPGPRAAVTDPDSGGNRWETDPAGEVWPVPTDTTGDAATGFDPTSGLHARYRTLLGILQDAAGDLLRFQPTILPPQPNTRVVPCTSCGAPKAVDTRSPDNLEEIAAAGYCRSCWRNDKACHEIQTDKSGTRYYREYCRPCGSFKAIHGSEPPMAILRARHEGRKVTIGFLEEHCPHCKAEAKATPAGTDRPKGKRGWRRHPEQRAS